MPALNHNPLQDSLIPELHESTAIFGDVPDCAAEVVRISGQRAQVETIMADGQWRTLPGLQKELKRRFNTLYAETSISARLRGLRKCGFYVESRRTRPGSGLFEYRATRPMPKVGVAA